MDGRKLSALKYWRLIEEQEDGKLKLLPDGRDFAKGEDNERKILLAVVKRISAYSAIIERAAHRHEDSLDTAEVGAHWHDHFPTDAGETDKIVKDQAVCFFNVAAGAGLGTVIAGRKGKPTRISFLADQLRAFISSSSPKELKSVEDAQKETEVPEINDSTEEALESTFSLRMAKTRSL